MGHHQSKTILFITGAFVHHSCWDDWCTFFQGKGYKTFAPAWPYKDDTAEALRKSHPNSAIASNRLHMLTKYFATFAKQLPEKPILIGHSIGGLLVQLLLQEGLGALGIAIHSVPPQGIMTFKFSFIKAGWGPLGFFTSTKKSFLHSFSQWKYAFTNGMTAEEQKNSYYQYTIPESKLIVRDTITKAAKINFENPHAPLLFISGSNDHTIPASLNYANFRKYRKSNSTTDYQEFAGHTHFVLGQPDWKKTAEFVFEWIKKQYNGSTI
ncbi:alpha/beta fold hydrolase [Flavihumibacter petaseus]|uniref:AB hydrolase-1 domain-containing protein n=1 Tax=Flavihumibacter petaseus NBRC 106054 TaxID=1220578 RepID=A0A0E9MXB2_9BACT|nr:alpha/beta hydrolase [Flavihumibacter petaseus]GAO41760.1 hypothetical protein FPE01S_01_07740 [Flavihumibacter petaseus NBRC 106054]